MVKVIQLARVCFAACLSCLIGASILLPSGSSARADADEPSFDCVTALTKDEIVICAALGNQDRDLAKLFEDLIASLPEDQRAALIKDQGRWVARRNAACGISNDTDIKPATWWRLVECFREQYRTRAEYLRTAQSSKPASPPAPAKPNPPQSEVETIWKTAADDPQGALEKLRTRSKPYAEILGHALSPESDEAFNKFAEAVLEDTGSSDGETIYIPCNLIQKFPRLLELTRGYHGGNRDNFTPRADCDVAEAGLPASVDQLLDHLDRSIRNSVTSFACGTSRYARFKDIHLAEIRMAFVPQTYLDPARPTGHWIADQWTPLTEVPLERWSYASLANRIAFKRTVEPGFLQARADLAAYYEWALGMKAEDARTAAHRALWDQVGDLGSDAGGYFPYPVSPINQAILSNAPVDRIVALVGAETTPTEFGSPIEAAAARHDVIRMLAAKGYPIGNALMIAAAHSDAPAIDALVAAGADVNQATPELTHEQILSEWQGNRNCANVPPPDGITGAQTPLMIAAQSGRLSVIQRLLEHGADKHAADSRGYRALDYLQLRSSKAAERFSAAQMATARRLLD
jgi:uncharacterized protein YecT (DUF1311 family)